jgi:hypothetical protein
MGQRNNDEWERLRNNRLTASNFGRIINMKITTDTANTIIVVYLTNLHTNELNTTFFGSTSPLKASNRLKSLKLA